MTVRVDHLGKNLTPFSEGKASQVAILMREDIERIIDNARLSGTGFLQEVEVGVAVRSDSDYLPVNNGACRQIFQCLRNVAESIVEYVPFTRVKRDVLFSPHGFKSIPVELDFLCGATSYVAFSNAGAIFVSVSVLNAT